MKRILYLAAAAAVLTASLPAGAAAPEVVASIRPVHSLVAMVMAGVGEPVLMIDGSSDPHTYALRPSDAASLSAADLVFWIGPGIEPFLADTLPTLLAGEGRSVELAETPGLVLLSLREGGLFEAHEHEAGHDEALAEPGADGHEHHAGEEHAAEAGGHAGEEHAHAEDEHGHDGIDAHVWLDPANAEIMLAAIAARLAAADPANADAYRANADAAIADLGRLASDVRRLAEPVRDGQFITFHDAFQYFEAAFGVRAVGSVTINPEVTPGARRVAELQARIRDTGVECLVTQPQFPSDLVELLATEATRTAVLDDLGADIPAGPALYETLLRRNAEALAGCIAGES